MKIPLNFGGGSGSGSDDCTATAEDVLETKTAIYNGSDDEPEYGTMKDYSGTTNAASAITQNGGDSRIELTIPNIGKYDTASKIYYAYSNLASTIGLTAAKIATGNTILGIAGTYTGLGSATAAQVLSGKTFSTASLSNASGTMTDKSGTSTSATSSTSGSNYRLLIPANGYYNTSAYLTNSYSNTASTIGLTAAKLKSGESVLGVTGSWSGYVATSTDVYYCGSTNLAGSASTIGTSTTATLETSCIVLNSGNTGATNVACGVVFANTINTGSYSKVTATYQVLRHNYSGSSYPCIGIGMYSSKPSSTTDLKNATISEEAVTGNTSIGSGGTVSLSLSGSSSSMYIAVYYYGGTGSATWAQVTVSRIQVS